MHTGRDEDITQRPIEPGGQVYIGMCKLRRKNGEGLKDHHSVYRRAGKENTQEEKDPAQHAFHGVMTQPGGDVYVIIRMVHYVEFPKGKYLVLDQVHQPPAEKIKNQER